MGFNLLQIVNNTTGDPLKQCIGGKSIGGRCLLAYSGVKIYGGHGFT